MNNFQKVNKSRSRESLFYSAYVGENDPTLVSFTKSFEAIS